MEITASKTLARLSGGPLSWVLGFCKRPVFILFLVSRAAVVLLFESVGSDVPWAYFPAVQALASGTGAPYHTVPFPYPPGALLAVLAPALVRTDYHGYHLAFQAEMVLVDVLTFVLLARFLERTLQLGRSRVLLGLTVYAALTALLGVFIYDRLDLWICVVFMLALTVYRPGRDQSAVYRLIMAAGTLIKIVPAFWIAPFVSPTWKSARRWLVFFVVPVAGVLLVTDLVSHGGLMRSLGEHGQRGIEIESLWATPFVVARGLGVSSGVVADTAFGSVNIAGAAVPPVWVAASKWVGFVALIVFYGWWMRRHADHPFVSPAQHFLVLFFVLLLLLATQRVLSPQYFIWLVPGFAIAIATSEGSAIAVIALAALYGLTSYLFPLGFADLIAFRPAGAFALAARNLLLLGMVVYVWMALRRVPDAPDAQ